MTRTSAIAIAILVSIGPSQAGLSDDIATCIGIKDDKDRLACFDAAAKLMISRMQSDPESAILQRFKKTKPTDGK